MNADLYNELAAASEALNYASDQLHETVQGIADQLKGLRIGVEVWHPCGVLGNGWKYEIGYAKIHKRWAIAIAEIDSNGVREEWEFSDAPRVVRIEAAKSMDDLLEALLAAARTMHDDVCAVRSDLRTTQSALAQSAATYSSSDPASSSASSAPSRSTS